MDQTATFEQILKEKMGLSHESALNTAPFCPVWTLPKRPISAIFFNRRIHIPSAGLRAYPKKSSPQRPDSLSPQREVLEKTPIHPTEPCISHEAFSKDGQKQMALLIYLGAQLDPLSFTESELKQEYRRLIKRYHPDLNRAQTAARTLNQVVCSYRGLCLEIKDLADPAKPNHSKNSKN